MPSSAISLYKAFRQYAQSQSPASTQQTSSTPGSGSGNGNAYDNAVTTAYETFAEKSDKAIVIASREQREYIYTASYVQSAMQVTYTTDRNGKITDLRVISSCGNTAIDNAIMRIIRSAQLPAVPPEHTDTYITRHITIYIRKAPGKDPLILSLVRT